MRQQSNWTRSICLILQVTPVYEYLVWARTFGDNVAFGPHEQPNIAKNFDFSAPVAYRQRPLCLAIPGVTTDIVKRLQIFAAGAGEGQRIVCR
jgi:hypothetical protein